ncbi:hypothetical protein C0J52_13372 [Blattella germanica]|nr:hypothetical protein C0J52_13372 [Blattella germanica]
MSISSCNSLEFCENKSKFKIYNVQFIILVSFSKYFKCYSRNATFIIIVLFIYTSFLLNHSLTKLFIHTFIAYIFIYSLILL